MCFSANASFGASAVLAVIGVAAVVKAKKTPERLFAAIPFIFSIQQLSEGMLWLSFKEPGLVQYHSIFVTVFLVFALVVWPFYIPFTVWLLEKDAHRKKILSVFLTVGAVVSISLVYVLSIYSALVVPNHHIHFSFSFPPMAKNLTWLFSLLYFIATIISPFFSSIKRMKWLGVVFLVSYLFSLIFYSGYLVSIWCYFAALLSIVILWIVAELRISRS
jgi:hypothetical protein